MAFSAGSQICPPYIQDEEIHRKEITRWMNRKSHEAVSITDFGADPNGITPASLAIQKALDSGAGYIWVPDGRYLIDIDLTIGNSTILAFSKGAIFLAGVNGRIILKSTVSAYYSQVWNATFDGNGFTGVRGYDMKNFRLQAGLFNCSVRNMATGFFFRDGCFGTQLLNPDAVNVPTTLQVIANGAVLDIIHPTFDNEVVDGGTGDGIAIEIQAGGVVNIGVRIMGGFVQGYSIGVQDAGLATHIDGTYFEACTTADIYFSSARNSSAFNTVHPAAVGAAAFKARSCDAVTIFNPMMPSGNRTVMYDFDSTNTNCVEYHTSSNASYNTPTGSLTNFTSFAQYSNASTTFTPVVAGTTAAGAGTYTRQSGTVTKINSQVHVQIEITWTAHTGTGNITITGIPTAFTPASFVPKRVGNCNVDGLAWTGPTLYTDFSGTSTTLRLVQTTVAGVNSLVPIAGTGTIYINIVYDM